MEVGLYQGGSSSGQEDPVDGVKAGVGWKGEIEQVEG